MSEPSRSELNALADRIAAAQSGWLPIAGHVATYTFTLAEREMAVNALRAAKPERERVIEECASLIDRWAAGYEDLEIQHRTPDQAVIADAMIEVAKEIRALKGTPA